MTSQPQHLKQVIVIGQKIDHLLQQAVAWLKEDQWTVEHGAHLYSVAAFLGRTEVERILVIGRPDALVRRRRELLHLLVNKGILTCGLMTGEDGCGLVNELRVQACGVPVFRHMEAFSAWLKLHADPERMLFSADRTDHWGDQYRTTESELAALFGDDDRHGGK